MIGLTAAYGGEDSLFGGMKTSYSIEETSSEEADEVPTFNNFPGSNREMKSIPGRHSSRPATPKDLSLREMREEETQRSLFDSFSTRYEDVSLERINIKEKTKQPPSLFDDFDIHSYTQTTERNVFTRKGGKNNVKRFNSQRSRDTTVAPSLFDEIDVLELARAKSKERLSTQKRNRIKQRNNNQKSETTSSLFDQIDVEHARATKSATTSNKNRHRFRNQNYRRKTSSNLFNRFRQSNRRPTKYTPNSSSHIRNIDATSPNNIKPSRFDATMPRGPGLEQGILSSGQGYPQTRLQGFNTAAEVLEELPVMVWDKILKVRYIAGGKHAHPVMCIIIGQFRFVSFRYIISLFSLTDTLKN